MLSVNTVSKQESKRGQVVAWGGMGGNEQEASIASRMKRLLDEGGEMHSLKVV